jgi:hypothetical protein
LSVEFYSAFFQLSKREREHLEALTDPDAGFDCVVNKAATFWRKHLRRQAPSDEKCRILLAKRTLGFAVTHGLGGKRRSRLPVAYSMLFTDIVKERVLELDKEEMHVGWN